jgi:hypothetical protein
MQQRNPSLEGTTPPCGSPSASGKEHHREATRRRHTHPPVSVRAGQWPHGSATTLSGCHGHSLYLACVGLEKRGRGKKRRQQGGRSLSRLRAGWRRSSPSPVITGHGVDNPAAAGARHRHKGKEKHKRKERGETPAASGQAVLDLTVADGHAGHRRFTHRHRCRSKRRGGEREMGLGLQPCRGHRPSAFLFLRKARRTVRWRSAAMDGSWRSTQFRSDLAQEGEARGPVRRPDRRLLGRGPSLT